MQAMPAAEQKALIKQTAQRRAKLTKEVQALAKQRADFLKRKVQERGGAKDSLDAGIYRAVREQGAAAGLHYNADAPSY
jgi:peptidoglycan hydrolase CwlO-like protein